MSEACGAIVRLHAHALALHAPSMACRDSYVDRLRDFHLLLFLSHLLDEQSIDRLCDVVLECTLP